MILLIGNKCKVRFVNRILLQRKKVPLEGEPTPNGKSLDFFLNVCFSLTLAVEDSWHKGGGQNFFTEFIHIEGVPK